MTILGPIIGGLVVGVLLWANVVVLIALLLVSHLAGRPGGVFGTRVF